MIDRQTNDNDNDNVSVIDSQKNLQCNNVNDKHRMITAWARSVSRKMGNEENQTAFKLYCKAFYHLSQAQVWDAVELAKSKGRNPAKYLSWLLTNLLNK